MVKKCFAGFLNCTIIMTTGGILFVSYCLEVHKAGPTAALMIFVSILTICLTILAIFITCKEVQTKILITYFVAFGVTVVIQLILAALIFSWKHQIGDTIRDNFETYWKDPTNEKMKTVVEKIQSYHACCGIKNNVKDWMNHGLAPPKTCYSKSDKIVTKPCPPEVEELAMSDAILLVVVMLKEIVVALLLYFLRVK